MNIIEKEGGGRKGEGGEGEDSANLENEFYSTLEKTELWRQWFPRAGGGGVEKTEHRGLLDQ